MFEDWEDEDYTIIGRAVCDHNMVNLETFLDGEDSELLLAVHEGFRQGMHTLTRLRKRAWVGNIKGWEGKSNA